MKDDRLITLTIDEMSKINEALSQAYYAIKNEGYPESYHEMRVANRCKELSDKIQEKLKGKG